MSWCREGGWKSTIIKGYKNRNVSNKNALHRRMQEHKLKDSNLAKRLDFLRHSKQTAVTRMKSERERIASEISKVVRNQIIKP
jgi:hypothetical protein